MADVINGTGARLNALDVRVDSVADEQREQRRVLVKQGERTAVNEREIAQVKDAVLAMENRMNERIGKIHERLDSQTRAFWAAAGTMGALVVAIVTAIGVFLGVS